MLKCQRKVVSDDAKKFNSQHASFIANHSLTQQGHTRSILRFLYKKRNMQAAVNLFYCIKSEMCPAEFTHVKLRSEFGCLIFKYQ